jgi:hypothetical protein
MVTVLEAGHETRVDCHLAPRPLDVDEVPMEFCHCRK